MVGNRARLLIIGLGGVAGWVLFLLFAPRSTTEHWLMTTAWGASVDRLTERIVPEPVDGDRDVALVGVTTDRWFGFVATDRPLARSWLERRPLDMILRDYLVRFRDETGELTVLDTDGTPLRSFAVDGVPSVVGDRLWSVPESADRVVAWTSHGNREFGLSVPGLLTAFAVDDNLVVAGGMTGLVSIFDTVTLNRRLLTFGGLAQQPVLAVEPFAGPNPAVAVIAGLRPNRLFVVDAQTLGALPSGLEEDTLQAFDVAVGAAIAELPDDGRSPVAMQWLPGGDRLVIARRQRILIVDTKGTIQGEIPLAAGSRVAQLAPVPGSRLLVAVVWSADDTVLPHGERPAEVVLIAANGRVVARSALLGRPHVDVFPGGFAVSTAHTVEVVTVGSEYRHGGP